MPVPRHSLHALSPCSRANALTSKVILFLLFSVLPPKYQSLNIVLLFCLYFKFDVKRIIQNVFFCVWFVMFVRITLFLHVFFYCIVIPILFIHGTANKHRGCFQFSSITKNATWTFLYMYLYGYLPRNRTALSWVYEVGQFSM